MVIIFMHGPFHPKCGCLVTCIRDAGAQVIHATFLFFSAPSEPYAGVVFRRFCRHATLFFPPFVSAHTHASVVYAE